MEDNDERKVDRLKWCLDVMNERYIDGFHIELVEIPATYSSFLSCADTKSSWIPRVRFIRFDEDICVPLRCPLPASIDEQKGSKKILDAYNLEAWRCAHQKAAGSSISLSVVCVKRKHR